MVIFGSLLCLLGSVFPIIIRFSAFGGLGHEYVLALIFVLSFICLFTHRHPSLGVLIAFLSLFEICKDRHEIFTALGLLLTLFGALIIIASAHREWIEKKEADFNGI